MNSECQEKFLKWYGNEESNHYPVGPFYTYTQKVKGLINIETNELAAVSNFVESHAPTLRFLASHQYEKVQEQNENLSLDKENFKFSCNGIDEQTTEIILNQLKEMPKEWTIVQLTSKVNIKDYTTLNSETKETPGLHLVTLNCGKSEPPPFIITLDPPYDEISEKVINVINEIRSIMDDNLNTLQVYKKSGKKVFTNDIEKFSYSNLRLAINHRLKNLVKVLQNKWLRIWRCLFIGKYVDEKTEKNITTKIQEILKTHNCNNATPKTMHILRCLVKGSHLSQFSERTEALNYLFPNESDKDLRCALNLEIPNINKKYKLEEQVRQPVILIVDEKLDNLPWEMIDVLYQHPVSRMPTLQLTYALFKEHKKDIKHGYKIIKSNGTYIINPGLDLASMEVRLRNFFKYWVPNWSGLIGVTPTQEDFQNLLTTNDIFIYNGHGSGSQFLPTEKIKKMRINGIVMLFGCSSVQLQSIGPQVEMFGSYQTYTIACSPCVIGMLWVVTDVDTDLMSTELISQLIKSDAENHWHGIDKRCWEKTGQVTPILNADADKSNQHEPDLLRALWIAKNAARQYLTKAACVVRGIPVKVVYE